MMKFEELEKSEFEEFSREVETRNFLQSIQMFNRYEKKNLESYLVGVKSGNEIICAALINTRRAIFGKKIFVAPRGMLMDFSRDDREKVIKFFTQEVKKFLKKKSGLILQISPNYWRNLSEEEWIEGEKFKKELKRAGYKDLGEFEQVKWIYNLELEGRGAEEIYSKFRSGHKWSIRYAKERYGVKVRELDIDELEIFKELTNEASKKHGFVDPGIKYYKEMKEAFSSDVKFMVAEMTDPKTKKKEVMAGGMFVFWGDEAVYLFSGMRDEYKKYGGPHLIQWEMIQLAIKNGCRRYNFFGTHPGDGVYEFKRGFRGKMQELLGTFAVPISVLGRLYLKKIKYQKYGKIH